MNWPLFTNYVLLAIQVVLVVYVERHVRSHKR